MVRKSSNMLLGNYYVIMLIPFQNDLDLGKCNILKHNMQLTDQQPFKERYMRIPPHLFEEVKQHLQEMVEVGAIGRSFSLWPVQ